MLYIYTDVSRDRTPCTWHVPRYALSTRRVNCCYKVLCVQFLFPCWWKAVNINSNTVNTSWKTFEGKLDP